MTQAPKSIDAIAQMALAQCADPKSKVFLKSLVWDTGGLWTDVEASVLLADGGVVDVTIRRPLNPSWRGSVITQRWMSDDGQVMKLTSETRTPPCPG